MKKQYAVFGLGSFGESVAIELQKLGCEVVAIDANMERVEAIANQVSYAMKADIEDADFIRSLGTRNLDGGSGIRQYGSEYHGNTCVQGNWRSICYGKGKK